MWFSWADLKIWKLFHDSSDYFEILLMVYCFSSFSMASRKGLLRLIGCTVVLKLRSWMLKEDFFLSLPYLLRPCRLLLKKQGRRTSHMALVWIASLTSKWSDMILKEIKLGNNLLTFAWSLSFFQGCTVWYFCAHVTNLCCYLTNFCLKRPLWLVFIQFCIYSRSKFKSEQKLFSQ